MKDDLKATNLKDQRHKLLLKLQNNNALAQDLQSEVLRIDKLIADAGGPSHPDDLLGSLRKEREFHAGRLRMIEQAMEETEMRRDCGNGLTDRDVRGMQEVLRQEATTHPPKTTAGEWPAHFANARSGPIGPLPPICPGDTPGLQLLMSAKATRHRLLLIRETLSEATSRLGLPHQPGGPMPAPEAVNMVNTGGEPLYPVLAQMTDLADHIDRMASAIVLSLNS